MTIEEIVRWAVVLKAETAQILGAVETSKTRRLTLNSSYEKLGALTLKQDDLFRQALRCVEHELYRAAHVMAWAAFVDLLHELIVASRLKELQNARHKWVVKRPEDLRNYSDFQVIEVAVDIRIISKTVMKGLHGLLNKRNECAHPEDYFPTLNDTLGYIDEIFKRAEYIRRNT